MASEEAAATAPPVASADSAPAPSSSTVTEPTPAPSTAEKPAASTADTTPAPPPAAEASSSSSAAPAPKKKTVKAGTKNYSTDPALYIYTSLTAGNMHIVTATSRLETILRANRVPFKALDLATDEKARMLWGRRAGKTAEGKPRRLPALVQLGMVLGDLSEIDEWNEYGELKQHVKIYYDEFTQPPKGAVAPVPKYKQPANREAHPPAALNPPPPAPPMPDAAQLQAKKIAMAVKAKQQQPQQQQPKQPVKSVAEEAADRANAKAAAARQARIEMLREKVHGAKKETAEGEASGKAEEGEAAAEPPTKELGKLSIDTPSPSIAAAAAGLQSPTSGAWRETGELDQTVLQTVQSPTSSSWKPPAETSLASETFAGARVESASAEEIQRVEEEATIKEEPEPDSSEEAKVQAKEGGDEA